MNQNRDADGAAKPGAQEGGDSTFTELGLKKGLCESGTQVAEWLTSNNDFRKRLLSYGRNNFGIDRETLDELLQETAVELMCLKYPIAYPEGLALRVFSVRCLRHLKRRKDLADYSVQTIGIPAEAPEAVLQLRLDLGRAIQRLSPTCRRVLLAHYVEGKTLRETAGEVGRSAAGISRLASRCLQRLKDILDEKEV